MNCYSTIFMWYSCCCCYSQFNIAICMTSNQYHYTHGCSYRHAFVLTSNSRKKSWTKIKSNHDMIYDFLFEECVKCWWFFALSLDFDIWKCRPLNFSRTHDSWCERGILHPWISAFRSKGAAAAMTIRTASFRCFESIIIELINHDHFSRIQPAKFVLIANPRNCMRSMIFSPSLSLSLSRNISPINIAVKHHDIMALTSNFIHMDTHRLFVTWHK